MMTDLRRRLIRELRENPPADWNFNHLCRCAINVFERRLASGITSVYERQQLLGLLKHDHDRVFYGCDNAYVGEVTPEKVADLLEEVP